MYHLKRSIRRHAMGCAGLLCLILVVASASRCTSDSITGGENPAPENSPPENPPLGDPDPVETPLRVGSVTLAPDSLTVALRESAQLSVIVRDTDGAVIPDPQVVFTVSSGLLRGTVDTNGLVTGLAGGCGRGTVVAWSGGVNSNAGVITVGSPSAPGCWDFLSEVGSVTLSPDSLTVAPGQTAQLSVIVRDTAGALIARPQVVFSLYGTGFAGRPRGMAVDSTGLVTGGCGTGTVIARSRGVDSNAAVVTIGCPVDDNPWDY
jgi:hypothetical protein